uniref:DPPIV_N domain-containing protein n=1 Tax=Heterorhabditis bacteriophora TaxID=37862 RepID=A0A1I7WVP9_HETBA
MRNVYATNHGMLVERNWLSEDDYKNTNVELVYIYSISHPLNEMLPVIYKPKDSLTQWMFCWERDELTVVDSTHECLLIFDRINQVHRIYRVRETSESEVRSTLRMIDKRCDLQSTPIGTVPSDG